MTNQMQGEILFAGWEGGPLAADEKNWAHTPWMPVRGDYATFGVEVLVVNGVTLTWEVQTRTAEDPAVTSIAGSPTISTVTVGRQLNTTACKQLVRYRFSTGSTPSTTNFVVFRALQPSWQIDR
jgi:hypothetical protein